MKHTNLSPTRKRRVIRAVRWLVASTVLALATAMIAAAAAATPPAPTTASPSTAAEKAAPWTASLYLRGDNVWRQRIAAVISNESEKPLEGWPAAVKIGAGDGEADLAGTPAQALRVVMEPATEVQFALRDAAGAAVTDGPVTAGATLLIPAEAAAKASVRYWIYFDNPGAGRVPEFFAPPKQAPKVQATVRAGKPERLALTATPETFSRDSTRSALSSVEGSVPAAGWPQTQRHRAVVQAANVSDEAADGAMISLDLTPIANRMRGRLDRGSLRLVHDGRDVPHVTHGDTLLWPAAVPARSLLAWQVYFDETRADGAPKPAAVAPAAAAPALTNLLANASFEDAGPMPAGWNVSGGGKDLEFGVEEGGAPGQGGRCAQMRVPAEAGQGWRGWTQTVPVKPGRAYVIGGWIRTRDVPGMGVQLHLHCLQADGKLCATRGMLSLARQINSAEWTFTSAVVRMPPDAAKMSVHLTMNQTGTVWHDGLFAAEAYPVEVVRMEGRPMPTADALAVWQVNAIEKVFQDEPAPNKVAAGATIELARNEKEPLQLAVRSGRAIESVEVEVGPLVGRGGARLTDVQVAVAGYVPVDYPSNYYNVNDEPAWRRRVPTSPPGCDGWAGLWPDPLLPRKEFRLAANATQAVWITVGADKTAAPGDYTGEVRLSAGGKAIARVPVRVHVWNFTLPDESHVAAIYDVRVTGRDSIWGASGADLYEPVCRFMAERRLCGDRIMPAPKIAFAGGKVTADFAEFDAAAERYFKQYGFLYSYTPQAFYMFGWGHPPGKKFGKAPYAGDAPADPAARKQLQPEFREAYKACLRAFWDHVKAKGWADRFVLYICDEPYDKQPVIREQMKALCDLIHEVDPKIPIYSSTWHHVPEWDGYLNVWGLGHYGVAPEATLAKIKADGARLWFTTDGQMCLDTPYCAVERLLPHYCFKYGAEAYEFWGVAWLTFDPSRYGWHAYIRQSGEPGRWDWVRYPNGDGYLIYPGKPYGHAGLVSSIRLEQAREGVEDYEYLYLLRARAAKARASGRDTAAADRALAEAATLVAIPNGGGRYSSKILPDPDAVLRARRAVAAAIEGLEP